mmetsp:Transcript_2784/g.4161  ORF Transcript_2784/g.4161 Transcript_2784/m.4161 type:complete len:119 (-) Transcript_2784:77-433(-)
MSVSNALKPITKLFAFSPLWMSVHCSELVYNRIKHSLTPYSYSSSSYFAACSVADRNCFTVANAERTFFAEKNEKYAISAGHEHVKIAMTVSFESSGPDNPHSDSQFVISVTLRARTE